MMIEPVKDLKSYLGINKVNGYGLLSIGSIVEYKIPIKKVANKKAKKSGATTPGIGRGQFNIRLEGAAFTHDANVITEADIADYLEDEFPDLRDVDNDGVQPIVQAINPDQFYVPTYTYAGEYGSMKSSSKTEVTEAEYDSMKLQLSALDAKFSKASKDNNYPLSSLLDLQMKISLLRTKINNSSIITLKENTTLEKYKLITDFIKLTGKNPAIIKAYIVGNRLISTNTNLTLNLQEHRDVKNGRSQYLLKVFFLDEDNKIRFKYYKAANGAILDYLKPQEIMDIYPALVKAKIKDFKNSSEVFGLENKKSEVVGNYIDNWKIYYGSSKNLGRSTFYLALNPGKDQMKFVLQDIEFIDPELKGYTLAKDHSISVGDKVKIVEHKVSNYTKLNQIGEVISYKKNPSSKRIKGTGNRRKDHVTIRLENRSIITVYAEDLKKVENDSKIKEGYLF